MKAWMHLYSCNKEIGQLRLRFWGVDHGAPAGGRRAGFGSFFGEAFHVANWCVLQRPVSEALEELQGVKYLGRALRLDEQQAAWHKW